MKNFGIKQIGFYQTGTPKGGLQPKKQPKSWGSAVPPYHGNYINSDPFLEYWFANRKQNPKYQDQLYDIDTQLNRYRNSKAFDDVKDYTKAETIQDLGYFDKEYYDDLLNKNIKYEVIPRIGVTDFLKKLIYYPKNNRRVQLHENTHALWAEPQYDKISEKVGFWNDTEEYYDDNPDEIYSRLMELREYYKLDPNKQYSIEEIQKLIQQGKENNWNFNILDRYTPEQIQHLINEVAHNPIETNSNYKPLVAKKGSKILIKKKNRGKFTEYCGGEVTNECIQKAKKSKNPTLRKRATFAQNARGWAKKHQVGGRLDIKGLMNDPEFKKNYNLYINPGNITIANDSLINRGANNAQIGAVLTQIISESGGETKPHGNGAYGLIGWRGERAKGLPTTLSGQLHHLMKGLFESHKDWSDGGPGMNIGTGKEMQQFFKDGAYNNYRKATNAVMNGYVRPPEDQKAKRHALVQLVKKYMK